MANPLIDIDSKELENKLALVRKNFVELGVVCLLFCVFFLFKLYVSVKNDMGEYQKEMVKHLVQDKKETLQVQSEMTGTLKEIKSILTIQSNNK